jgi:hypothetical protein
MTLEESAKPFESCRLHYSLRELCFAASGFGEVEPPLHGGLEVGARGCFVATFRGHAYLCSEAKDSRVKDSPASLSIKTQRNSHRGLFFDGISINVVGFGVVRLERRFVALDGWIKKVP